jgi:ribokinase
VDVGGLLSRHNASSQKAFIAIEEGSGRRTIFWKRPSGPPLKAEELGGNFPGETDFLLLDGLMTEVSYHAAEKAREKGVPVMLDAGSPRPGLSELARRCDYLVASAAFAKGLGWSLEADALKSERDRLGVKVLTITCGEEGSLTVDEDRFLAVPAFAVKTLDTTGAGDVFHGGYIYGLLRKWGLRDIIIFASALAAIKCTSLGGRAGIPNLDGVTDFLKGRGISLPD